MPSAGDQLKCRPSATVPAWPYLVLSLSRYDNAGDLFVRARSYSALAAIVFAIVAILQFARAFSGWPLVVGSADIPVGASWVVAIGASVMAVLGFLAAVRD